LRYEIANLFQENPMRSVIIAVLGAALISPVLGGCTESHKESESTNPITGTKTTHDQTTTQNPITGDTNTSDKTTKDNPNTGSHSETNTNR
jgi:hypothetical protein